MELNIFISSCDEYADLWDPFFDLFFKYWPDCPFPVFLNSVRVPYYSSSVQQVLVGSRLGWGDGVIKGLKSHQKIKPSKFVLLLLDDYLLNARVDTYRVIDCLKVLSEMNGHYLRLVPKPPPDTSSNRYPNIGEIKKKSPYRLSLQASIWRTDTLLALLRPTETPWDMEVLGSQRANKYDGFYCSLQPVMSYYNGVDRGKWTKDAYEFLLKSRVNFNEARGTRGDQKRDQSDGDEKKLRRLFKFLPLWLRLYLRATYSKLTKKNIT